MKSFPLANAYKPQLSTFLAFEDNVFFKHVNIKISKKRRNITLKVLSKNAIFQYSRKCMKFGNTLNHNFIQNKYCITFHLLLFRFTYLINVFSTGPSEAACIVTTKHVKRWMIRIRPLWKYHFFLFLWRSQLCYTFKQLKRCRIAARWNRRHEWCLPLGIPKHTKIII